MAAAVRLIGFVAFVCLGRGAERTPVVNVEEMAEESGEGISPHEPSRADGAKRTPVVNVEEITEESGNLPA